MLALGPAAPAAAATYAEIFGGRAYDDPQWQGFVERLDYKQGRIVLEPQRITLNVPKGFYFLGHEDSQRVLAAWGNPTTADQRSLGLLLPADSTPIDQDVWAAELVYDETGYIRDDMVGDLEPEALLTAIRTASRPDSTLSEGEGYGQIDIVGWAAPPYYDRANRRLYLAKEVRFGTTEDSKLNYTIFTLGRYGVLSTNVIAELSQLPRINAAIPAIASIATFDKGATYGEFLPIRDRYAPYGLEALMIGGPKAATGRQARGTGYGFWLIAVAAILSFGGMILLKILKDPDA